ncbi:MAG: hypothetical protein V4458_11670 [Pseudomonadota bacterium]
MKAPRATLILPDLATGRFCRIDRRASAAAVPLLSKSRSILPFA